ncbi:MAG: class I SAM-dependent methyltransferase [Bacteroidales bacterium]|nr:class I SAM-dependent methyltransferase [Bacteroidales bacterium]
MSRDHLGSVAKQNEVLYNSYSAEDNINASPHLKHQQIKDLYLTLVNNVFDKAKVNTEQPEILDLGSGDGSVTLPFLALGAKVTAVDISSEQLKNLTKNCKEYENMFSSHCTDVVDYLQNSNEKFDVIVINSFLHHIPDYMSLIQQCLPHLNPHGQFFSFQDPLRYDTLSSFNRRYSRYSYLSWRVFQGDFWGGYSRMMRRRRGVLLDDCVEDNAEYHVTRNGVDQDAIARLLKSNHFNVRTVKYFATQSALFQFLGYKARCANMFSIVAQKTD